MIKKIAMPLTIFMVSLVIFFHTGYGESIQTTEQVIKPAASSPAKNDAIDLNSAFIPLYATGVGGGLNMHTNTYYADSFKQGPLGSIYLQYFPQRFQKKKFLENLSFLLNGSYTYNRFIEFDNSFWNTYSLDANLFLIKPIGSRLYAFSSLGGGSFLNHFIIKDVSTDKAKMVLGGFAKATAGFGLVIAKRFDLRIGLEYQMQIDKQFSQHPPNHILGASASFGVRFEKPQPRIIVEDVHVPALFAALSPYYANHDVVSVQMVNDSGVDVSQLKVSIMIPDFMQSPTESKVIPAFKVDQKETISLPIVLSENVFNLTNVTSVTALVTVEYLYKQKRFTLSNYQSVDLHQKNAMIWDNDQKLGSFITMLDPSTSSFARHILNVQNNQGKSQLPSAVSDAMAIYEACNSYGLTYLPDPQSPIPGNSASVDYIQFPRDVLKERVGDCDDLTVLLCSLFEAVGIETAYVTVPGHIFFMFNTKIPANKIDTITKYPERVYSLDNTIWIPVEATALGREPFDIAWQWAADQMKRWVDVKGMTISKVREVQSNFPALALKGTIELTTPEFNLWSLALKKSTENVLAQTNVQTVESLIGMLDKDPQNVQILTDIGKLFYEEQGLQVSDTKGVVASMVNEDHLAQSEKFLNQAISVDSQHYPALYYLALVYIKQKRWTEAEDLVNRCSEIKPDDTKLYALLGIIYNNVGEGW